MSNQFSKHKWWIVTALLTLPLIVVAAVPNTFMANTTISSAAVNANFTALDARITALEAATAKTSATVIMNNVMGPISTTAAPVKTAMYTATGANPLLLLVSGSAYNSTGTALNVTVQFDGAMVGQLTAYTNEINSHKSLPARAITIPTPAAGAHTIGLLATTPTVTDTNDFFNVTVIELH
jgi:hypothetical protein